MSTDYIIPWYTHDSRFTPGTVADIGNIRIKLERTDRAKNNKYRLYMMIRTRKEDGIKDDLKRGVAVAQFSGKMTLQEVQEETKAYLISFLGSVINDFVN